MPPSKLQRLRATLTSALGQPLRRSTGKPLRARVEAFGAILQTVRPRALVFVDRAYARSVGVAPPANHPMWAQAGDDGELTARPLSAPMEAHLQLTNRCDVGCRGCYTAATPRGDDAEWGAEQWKRAIDELAAMGVFHLALGGGESATLPWLEDVARHAAARGLVPNLTTSGQVGLDRLLPIAHLFGQINVSLDGLGAAYQAVRGYDGFATADDALVRLRAVKREIGINVVVTRHNFEQIAELFAYARRRRLNEVELLRFKPSGRGRTTFAAMTCTDEQHRRFLPAVLAACRQHRVRARVDCSYTPMLAHHQPSRELLQSLMVYGCTGGDFLIGAKATGQVTACSFAAPPDGGPGVDALRGYWSRPDAFGEFRTWREAAEPCRSCSYHELCRGGCKVVSAHVNGDAASPDPECPRVIDWAGRARVSLPVLL